MKTIQVNLIEDDSNKQQVRAWITKEVARELDLKPGEWIYIQQDWAGVRSTRALVEGYLDDKEGLLIKVTPDRIIDGHIYISNPVKAWKMTEWA